VNQPAGGAPAPRPATQPHQPATRPPAQAPKKSRTGAYVRLAVVAVVIVLVLIFVFQNTHRVAMQFMSADFTAPMWLMLFIVLILGAIIGYGLGWMQFRRRRDQRDAGGR
jgi:uncharacterized integral membrane protein